MDSNCGQTVEFLVGTLEHVLWDLALSVPVSLSSLGTAGEWLKDVNLKHFSFLW